jgi:ubiquinone/menaquinone biosynthesis C-methylase UbiE
MEVDFEQEKEHWNRSALKEEAWLSTPSINRTLRWREIERHLEGVKTILDVGGATGAFSIPLARLGFNVTHLDFSPAMLEIAIRKAEELKNIRFLEGNAIDLSQFEDRSFDLVLNMDGPISSSGKESERVIRESCRVAKKRLILTTAHRAWMFPLWIATSLKAAGHLLPAVYNMLETGEWHPEQSPEDQKLINEISSLHFKAYLPLELKQILEREGMKVLRVGGIGSLANLCDGETMKLILKDELLLQQFLELCERYDREIMPEGPGTKNDTGLIAIGERN